MRSLITALLLLALAAPVAAQTAQPTPTPTPATKDAPAASVALSDREIDEGRQAEFAATLAQAPVARVGTMRPVWRPQQLPSIKLWLDADDSSTITHSSNAVSQWNDKSGNGYHATQSTSGSRPTWTASVQNGRYSVRFDGSNDYLESSASWSLNLANCAMYAVFDENSSVTDAGVLIGFPTGSNDYDNTTAFAFISGAASGGSVAGLEMNVGSPTGAYATGTKPSPVRVYGFAVSSSTITPYSNGTAGTTANNGAMSTANNGYRVGARYFGSTLRSYLNGDIFEIVIVSSSLAASDRQKLEGYLAHRWGLSGSLPSDHPYKNAAP